MPGILAIVGRGRERHEIRRAGKGFICGIVGTGVAALLFVALVIAMVDDGNATDVASQTRSTSTAASAGERAAPGKTPGDRAPADKAADDQGIAENAEADRVRAEKAAADEAASAAAAGLLLSGTGSRNTEHFTLPAGTYMLVWVASSSGEFAVGVHRADGSSEVLITERSPDPPSGEAFFVSDGTELFLSVYAPDQAWTFTFRLS